MDRDVFIRGAGVKRLPERRVEVARGDFDGLRARVRRQHEDAVADLARRCVARLHHIAAMRRRRAEEHGVGAGLGPHRGAASAVKLADFVAAEVDHHPVGVDVGEAAGAGGVAREDDEVRCHAHRVRADADKRPPVVIAALIVAYGRGEVVAARGVAAADGVDCPGADGVVLVVRADGVADVPAPDVHKP